MRSPCPEFDLFRHVLITGGTGCGKTVSVVLPLLARALAQDSNNENRKPALFLVDVKGDITAALRHMADINGRKDDIIEISAEAVHRQPASHVSNVSKARLCRHRKRKCFLAGWHGRLRFVSSGVVAVPCPTLHCRQSRPNPYR